MSAPLRIGIVAGEESGELLAADLIVALKAATGREIELVGVGGERLEELGLKSLFPSDEIGLMGVSAILKDLPRLIRRIGTTADAIVAANPDCLVTVDSPEFTLRVAKKVRAADPSIPIVHYVCPSVWAWRQGRAAEMKPYVDTVLCHLPFEPAELARLGGPPGVFVGHRLSSEPGVLAAAQAQTRARDLSGGAEKTLVVLPGSRKGEVTRLLEPFGETVDLMRQRGMKFRVLLPTVARVEPIVRSMTAGWAVQPEIVTGDEGKWRAFAEADAALCASGTVSLELGLAGIPTVSCYKLDAGARLLKGMVKVWSIVLPNLIADRPIIPEFVDIHVRPNYLARYLEALMGDTPLRQWQVEGFAEVRRRMATDRPAGELAAAAVLEAVGSRTSVSRQ